MDRSRNKRVIIADFLSCLNHIAFSNERLAGGSDMLAQHYTDFINRWTWLDRSLAREGFAFRRVNSTSK
jgi:hypothetical protein